MQAPVRPPEEAWRLEALRRYDVLDTAPEQALDAIAALAAHVCDVPICLISLVDEHRQWFKSRIGFDLEETSRDVSFCGHAILRPELFVVTDAAHDARFVDNPLVTGAPYVRSYVGAPLVTPDGHAIGTLCVMDQRPRELTAAQHEALRVLGRQVIDQLELRRRTRQLVESEARLLAVFRNCPAALTINRWSDGTCVDINAAFTDLTGWNRDELIGHTNIEMGIVSTETAVRLRELLNVGTAVRDATVEIRTRAGDVRQVLIGTELVELQHEQHAITTFVDITARAQAEAASSLLGAIVESSDDAIIGKDLNGIVTSWNAGAEQVFGYTAAEMVGASILKLIPADRQDEEVRILASIRRGDRIRHFETQRQTSDGRLIDVSVTVSPIRNAAGEVVGVSKVSRDITEQRQAAEARRASEARYRTLFDYAPDGIVIADADSYYLDANASICRMLGYTHDELVGLHASDIVAQSEASQITPALSAIKTTSNYQREWVFRRKDGSAFSADVIATVMPDGNLLGMIRDITERKRVEARFQRLSESNVQGVMFWNMSGDITSANDAFLAVVGYTREDLDRGAIRWAHMTPPEFAGPDRHSREEIAASGVCTPYEKEFFRKDGTRVPVLIGAAVFEDSPDEGVCFVFDLTQRKKLEQQFLRAQRMESVGTLAGGIAHDLNNVLAPILLGVEIVKDGTQDKEALEYLDLMRQSAEHGANLVKQLLTFARGVEGQRAPVKPRDLVGELLKVMRDTFPKSVDVRFSPPRDVWTVTGDATQLHQVFLNLCVNARDAMPAGGTLGVRMKNVVLDETFAAMNLDARPGAYVMIEVKDTGSGIPQEIRDRIFEPFFTTKEVGKGTGLGLSTTIAIVKSHGGFIHLYSELGTGTKFRVYLPANTTGAEAENVAIDQTLLPRGNDELLLIVDDEEAVRRVVKGTLERFGYRVLLAVNGAEAVALYAQHRTDIALVLTDMAMPIMDGPATIVALKSMNPAVKVIASSGLASGGALTTAAAAGVTHFVSKPYTAESLLKALDRELRGEDATG